MLFNTTAYSVVVLVINTIIIIIIIIIKLPVMGGIEAWVAREPCLKRTVTYGDKDRSTILHEAIV
jgi:hypothetical protein